MVSKVLTLYRVEFTVEDCLDHGGDAAGLGEVRGNAIYRPSSIKYSAETSSCSWHGDQLRSGPRSGELIEINISQGYSTLG
jgi:hypothetical protein